MKQLIWFTPVLMSLGIAGVVHAATPTSETLQRSVPVPSLAENVLPRFICPIAGQILNFSDTCECPAGQRIRQIHGALSCVSQCPTDGQIVNEDGVCVCPGAGEVIIDGRCEQAQCQFYLGTVSYCLEADNSDLANRLGIQCRAGKSLTLQQDAKNMSCIDRILNDCQARYPHAVISRDTAIESSKTGSDDAVMSCFAELADKSLNRPTGTTVAMFQQQLSDTNWGQYGFLAQTSYYLDQECQPVQLPKDQLVCGSVDVYSIVSPVSLLMNENVEIDLDQTVTDFPLELGTAGSYYTWKASAEAPLLVIDPERTGRIASASQLFGSWTFGGQPVVSRVGQMKPTPWENGFQALGVLDRNGDGELRREELGGLALWFDSNRNGRSELGEVRSLEEENITALFYRGAVGRDGTNDLYLDLGYERIRDGVTATGTSVDWYGERSNSPIESALREQLRSQLAPNSGLAGKPEQSTATYLPETVAKRPETEPSEIEGVWSWEMGPDEGPSFKEQGHTVRGVFVLKLRDEMLSGTSVLESPVTGADGTVLTQIAVFPLKGSVERDATGSQVLKFRISTEHSHTDSTAVFSPDRRLLVGDSVFQQSAANSVVKSIRYRWKAKRQ